MTTLSRRAVLAGSVMSAIPVPALAIPLDPIFAAIERHRAAWQHQGRLLEKNVENSLSHGPTRPLNTNAPSSLGLMQLEHRETVVLP